MKPIDLNVKCVEIEKYYMSCYHAKQKCCYEPVAIFKDKDGGLASLPYFGFRPEVGKRYRIRVEEIKK